MKLYKHIKRTAAIALVLILSGNLAAQKKMESPRDSCSGKVGKATITINYVSPSVKGREVWGALVPYGQVWRTGANEATTFKTDKEIQVEGKALPAGTYAFFAIPGENSWTLIFNKTSNQWGAFNYSQKEDALRVDVKPGKAAAMSERLVYKITKDGFSLTWENLTVPVRIQ
jgi:hypothetical protein